MDQRRIPLFRRVLTLEQYRDPDGKSLSEYLAKGRCLYMERFLSG